MSDRVNILEHKKKKFVFGDLSNLTEQDLIETQKEFTVVAVENKIPFIILDITNTTTTKAVKEQSKIAVESIKGACGFVYTVIIGISGIQKIIANAITRDIHFSANIADAQEHIVKKFPSHEPSV